MSPAVGLARPLHTTASGVETKLAGRGLGNGGDAAEPDDGGFGRVLSKLGTRTQADQADPAGAHGEPPATGATSKVPSLAELLSAADPGRSVSADPDGSAAGRDQASAAPPPTKAAATIDGASAPEAGTLDAEIAAPTRQAGAGIDAPTRHAAALEAGNATPIRQAGALDAGIATTTPQAGAPEAGIAATIRQAGALEAGIATTTPQAGAPEAGIAATIRQAGALKAGIATPTPQAGALEAGIATPARQAGALEAGIAAPTPQAGALEAGIATPARQAGALEAGIAAPIRQAGALDAGTPDADIASHARQAGTPDAEIATPARKASAPVGGIAALTRQAGAPDAGIATPTREPEPTTIESEATDPRTAGEPGAAPRTSRSSTKPPPLLADIRDTAANLPPQVLAATPVASPQTTTAADTAAVVDADMSDPRPTGTDESDRADGRRRRDTKPSAVARDPVVAANAFSLPVSPQGTPGGEAASAIGWKAAVTVDGATPRAPRDAGSTASTPQDGGIVTRVVVTNQETHLPIVTPPPALQLAQAIRAEVAVPDDGNGASASAAAPAAVGGTMVRTLSITLAPAQLGTLNVKMRLVGGRLELSIEAARPETARAVELDKAALAGALSAAGITLDAMVVRTGGGDPRAADGGTNGSAQSSNQPPGQQGGYAASGGDASRHDSRGSSRRDPTPDRLAEPPRSGDRAGTDGTARSHLFL